MKAEEIAQWVLDNRYKTEPERMTDAEMYNLLLDKIGVYKSMKCKEQRGMIAEMTGEISGSYILNAYQQDIVKNFNEPEL